MFDVDQRAVQLWCDSPDKLVDVVTMVALSIQQPWYGVGKQLADVRKHKAGSKFLWGHKKTCYLYMVEHQAELYAKVREYRSGYCSVVDLMRELLKVPGLGLAKAGFVVQLTCGQVGCMDSHNIRRFGLDAKFMRLPKLKNPAKQIAAVDDRIRAYVALCEACGGSEFLWDSWCNLIAAKNTKRFTDGDNVSLLHYAFLATN